MMILGGCCLLALTVAAHAERTPAPMPGETAAQRVPPGKAKKHARAAARAQHHKPAAASRPAHGKARTRETGLASWYGESRQGRIAANGEPFDKFELTAAHRTLPLDSRVRVTNLANGRSVTVRVTDRGPVSRSRIIDLSQSAAEELGMKRAGLARVHLEALPPITASNP